MRGSIFNLVFVDVLALLYEVIEPWEHKYDQWKVENKEKRIE